MKQIKSVCMYMVYSHGQSSLKPKSGLKLNLYAIGMPKKRYLYNC